ncbi:MAG: hypothetical protein ACPG05_01350, partial [Bdellovibrionales bacterium]
MIKFFLSISALLVLVACGSTSHAPHSQMEALEDKLLTENDFRLAVRHYLENGGGPNVSTYNIVLSDLNGDNVPEGLVMMNTPFNTWCHLAGCT